LKDLALQEDPDYFKKRELNSNFQALYPKVDLSKVKWADIMSGRIDFLTNSDSNEKQKIKTFEDGISFIRHDKSDTMA